MAGLLGTLNDAPAKAKAARSFGRNPKRAHEEDLRSAPSHSMAPEVTPCSSGAALLPCAERTLLGTLNTSLQRALAGEFSVRFK